VSENIVGGTNLTAPRGLTWWVNSPVHYNTLITTRYTEAGTGFSSAGDVNYYVLVVGQPGNAPPPSSANTDNSPEPLFITPITLAEPGEDGSIVHLVQDGQALWSLAAHYDVPLSDLLLYNGLQADAFVHTGDEIIIRLPEGAPIPPTPTPPTTHVVREGESLWTISALYNVRIGDVMWFNNLTEESFLQPGQEIKVRLAAGELPPPTPTPIVNHTVRAGQTLWEIALTYGLTLEQLLAFNSMEANAIIKPGDELRIRPLDTPTPTPLPTSTATPPTPTATVTPTPTSLSFPLAPGTAVAANVNMANSLVAMPTAAAVQEQTAGRFRPWLLGTAVFVAGLLALGGAFVVAVRKEKL
jgi:LysM repeat protein